MARGNNNLAIGAGLVAIAGFAIYALWPKTPPPITTGGWLLEVPSISSKVAGRLRPSTHTGILPKNPGGTITAIWQVVNNTGVTGWIDMAIALAPGDYLRGIYPPYQVANGQTIVLQLTAQIPSDRLPGRYNSALIDMFTYDDVLQTNRQFLAQHDFMVELSATPI